ncbi:MAG TPA: hypothetical protein EYP85_08010 [Armatimonadetes bacterium]|nr:hypothetical protein [Armatimonadota bacterium]
MTKPERVIVIGGDAAGMSAAAKAKRTNPELAITVYEKGRFVSYAACGIPYYLAGVVRELRALLVRTPEQFAQQGITVHLQHEVTALNLAAKEVTVVAREEGREFTAPYDKLVIATGATPICPPLEGLDAPNVFTLRHLEEAQALKDYLDRERPRRATLIGGGYLNLEMAEALRTRDLEVTVVEMQPQLLPSLDSEMAELVERELARQGVVVCTGEPVQGLGSDGTGRVRRVQTSSQEWETDLVLMGSGVQPNVALARAAGIELDTTGAIRTDRRMQTERLGVYAAGDCVSVHHLVSERRGYLPLGPTANKQGRVAGENLAGGEAFFRGVVGTSVVKVFDLEVARTGLNEREAKEANFTPVAAQITATDRASYYPGAVPLTVRLLADAATGRLLGGQIIGQHGAAKRIDVVAAALHGRMNVEQFGEFDLSYAPPYAPVWDPLLIAAQVLLREL